MHQRIERIDLAGAGRFLRGVAVPAGKGADVRQCHMSQRVAGVEADGLTECCSAAGQFHSSQKFNKPCEVWTSARSAPARRASSPPRGRAVAIRAGSASPFTGPAECASAMPDQASA